MKIVTIIGARPQFVKAAAFSRQIACHQDIDEIIIHTGQHYDANMSDIFFTELSIPKPDYSLQIGSGSHGKQTGLMLEKIEEVLIKEKPDWVLVYGDTNSTLAGALAATKLHIKVAHVEAGLRSFNRKMPEEINRIATDHLSDILFAPSKTAMANLSNEGLSDKSHWVGDIMFDAVLYYLQKKSETSQKSPFILSTIHRAENTDDAQRMKSIIHALNHLNKHTPVVLPLHPRTQKKLIELDLKFDGEIIKPVGYLEMLALLDQCQGVVTDSGGLQKEAFFCGKPCVTLRDETEWVELVELGANKLAPPAQLSELDLEQEITSLAIPQGEQPYGEGKAAIAIAELLANH